METAKSLASKPLILASHATAARNEVERMIQPLFLQAPHPFHPANARGCVLNTWDLGLSCSEIFAMRGRECCFYTRGGAVGAGKSKWKR